MSGLRLAAVVLLVGLLAFAFDDAEAARRGDLVYIFNNVLGTSLQVRSPQGVLRMKKRLASIDAIFNQLAVSADGQLAMMTIDHEFSSETADLYVVRIVAGKPQELSELKLSPFFKGALSTCSTNGPVAVGAPVAGVYPVFVGLACTLGCKSRFDFEGELNYSSTYVLSLKYDARTKVLAKAGAIRSSFTKVCSPAIGHLMRALAVLPDSAAPLMVLGERDDKVTLQTFDLRSTVAGKHVLTWKRDRRSYCDNFVISGKDEFFATCTFLSKAGGIGTEEILRIDIRTGLLRVTHVGPAPKRLGPGENIAMATVPGSSAPLYIARYSGADDRFHIVAHNKSRLAATGSVAFTFGKDEEISYNMVVVP